MRCLNFSYKLACLQCSFSDKEVSEYLQFKKRQSVQLPKKNAEMKVGKQPDGTWVLSSNSHVTSTGELVTVDASNYIWIGHVFSGPPLYFDGDPESSFCSQFSALCHDNGSRYHQPSLPNNA